ncbi:MAG: type II toxin-antitoxin system ParD family antitoxin [Pseudomonadota bacterium]
MSEVIVSMTKEMSDWVDSQVADGGYQSPADYVSALIRRDEERQRAAIAELDALLDEAEASGVSEKSIADVIESARQEAKTKGLVSGAR